MPMIEPFWEGARHLPSSVDVVHLAERTGGWAGLRACGVRELVDLGVPETAARAWREHAPGHTRGRALTLEEPDYPERLRRIPGAPAVLCVEGSVAALHGPAVALVGTRRCTPYGTAVARHLAGALASRGVTVVSGLARGIDGHAHRATLGVGRTVAVLGHGLDCTSPRSHVRLRQQIVEAGGAIVTGFPDDLGPARWTFPVRNTWIAALASDTVVVEAPLKSGALITAAEAASLGREVWAVPGPLGRDSSAGCLSLVAHGAGLIDDVEAFADRFGTRDRDLADPLVAALHDGATVEEIARRTDRPLTEVLARLATLEVQGRVVRLAGHRFAPARGPA